MAMEGPTTKKNEQKGTKLHKLRNCKMPRNIADLCQTLPELSGKDLPESLWDGVQLVTKTPLGSKCF